MAEEIQYEEFEAAENGTQPAPGGGAGVPSTDIRRLSEIPMELSVEIGRTPTTVGEALELQVGAVVPLARQAGEPVDLLVNGSPIARGEVVVVDERYGLRITEILDGRAEHPLAAAAGRAGDDPQGAEPHAPAAQENGGAAAGAEA